MGHSGFRMHMCLPMHKYHRGCGIDKTIERCIRGTNGTQYYSTVLLRENGTDFSIKPKNGQFCYAQDVRDRFPDETQTTVPVQPLTTLL